MKGCITSLKWRKIQEGNIIAYGFIRTSAHKRTLAVCEQKETKCAAFFREEMIKSKSICRHCVLMSKFFQKNPITGSSLPQTSQNKRQKVMTQKKKTVDRHFISCLAEMFSQSLLYKVPHRWRSNCSEWSAGNRAQWKIRHINNVFLISLW